TKRGSNTMDIEIRPRDGVDIVAISGSVDGLTAETLLTTLQRHVEGGGSRLVVDLSGVDYTSSAGLRALLATVKEARRRGRDLRLAVLTPTVRKVRELSGFATILTIFAGVDEAVASFAA